VLYSCKHIHIQVSDHAHKFVNSNEVDAEVEGFFPECKKEMKRVRLRERTLDVQNMRARENRREANSKFGQNVKTKEQHI